MIANSSAPLEDTCDLQSALQLCHLSEPIKAQHILVSILASLSPPNVNLAGVLSPFGAIGGGLSPFGAIGWVHLHSHFPESSSCRCVDLHPSSLMAGFDCSMLHH